MENRVIFDNDRKLLTPQDHSILLQSNTHLNVSIANKVRCFKCFNVTIPCFFLFIRKFRKYLFRKGVLIYQEKKRLTRVFISWEIMTGE